MGFFDRQQTGQLMSRATVDLQSVRFFLGYGLVFITQSALTIVLAAVAMIVLQPGLGAAGADPGAVRRRDRQPLRAAVAPGAAGGPAAHRRADRRRRGERRPACASSRRSPREERQLARFRGPRPARLRPEPDRHPPARLLQPAARLPAAARARRDPARRRPPGHRRDADDRRVRRLLHVRADAGRARCACSASRSACPSARSRPARGCSRSSTASRGAVDPGRAARAARRARPRRAARRHLRLRGRARAVAARRVADRPGRAHRRAGRRDRLGQVDAGVADPAPLRRDARAPCWSTAPTSATSTRPRCAARSPSSPTTRSCSATPSHENIAYARPDATREEVEAPRPARAGRRLHRASCPRATTRASASAG